MIALLCQYQNIYIKFQIVFYIEMYNDLNESSSSTDLDDEILETNKFKKIKQNKFLLGISI